MKKILITGKGTAGSWQIRGEQLGKAIGATVVADSRFTSLRRHDYDLVIVVKKIRPESLAIIHGAGIPIVYDIVDPWPQPDGNQWGRLQVIDWLRKQVASIKPKAVVCATQKMMADLAFDGPAIALPHHARPGQAINPIRREVRVVGYEGREEYLGSWRAQLETECALRGWRFVVNQVSLADLDIVVALRDGQWDGYAPRNWKSNIKSANAQATGTPCILSPECGYEENASCAEYWAQNSRGLAVSFDWLTPYENRLEVSKRLLARDNSLETVAKTYKNWLDQL